MVSEPEFIKETRASGQQVVVIDLRKEEVAGKSHIPLAFSVPANKLAESASRFPADKSAPIVLVDEDTAGMDAYQALKKLGYKETTVLDGGMKKWLASGSPVSAEGLATGAITYVKITPPDQITVEDFKKVAETKPADKLILDVRDAGVPVLPGAVQIPLGELEANLAKLPKDKEIIIHCNTGLTAGMAQDSLEKQGYRARFLNAIVQVSGDGSYEVAEK